MKKTIFILTVVWFLIIVIPTSILMFKVSIYLLETNFQEWWIMFIWALIALPIMTIVMLLRILNKESK